jgi:uncharacterized protein YabE (DUF348 family)
MKLANQTILKQPNFKYLIIAGVIGLIVFASTLCLSYLVALDRVQVSVDGKTIEYQTLKNTVFQVLAEKEIHLKQGDLVAPGLDTTIAEGIHIVITRSFPVEIKSPNRTITLYTVGPLVSDVLDTANLKYDVDDRITPALWERVKPGQTIEVIDVRSKIITSKVTLRSETEYRRDYSLEKGVTKVLREGQTGLAERREKVVYENGREKKRIILNQKVIKPKINTIIALGIRPILRVLETSRGSYRYLEMKLMDATAYSPGPESCGKYAKYGVTYTGKKAGFGIVAVDRRVIPLGTKLYIEGYGRAEAGDIGSAIKGNRIDLCYETYREAVMFGRKKVKVYILVE